MASTASETVEPGSEYLCETCEVWPGCPPHALSQEQEDSVYQELVEKGFIPRDPVTASYREWERSIRFMVRYGIIRRYDTPAECDVR